MAFRDEALMPTAKKQLHEKCVFVRFRNVLVEASAPLHQHSRISS
jgi:hypothetical protein